MTKQLSFAYTGFSTRILVGLTKESSSVFAFLHSIFILAFSLVEISCGFHSSQLVNVWPLSWKKY